MPTRNRRPAPPLSTLATRDATLPKKRPSRSEWTRDTDYNTTLDRKLREAKAMRRQILNANPGTSQFRTYPTSDMDVLSARYAVQETLKLGVRPGKLLDTKLKPRVGHCCFCLNPTEYWMNHFTDIGPKWYAACLDCLHHPGLLSAQFNVS